jgi:hypothetical protein
MEILIGLGVLLVAALVAAFLSSKTWHWGQVVLVLFVFLAGVGYVFLAADVLRKHRVVRSEYNDVTANLARLTVENAALLHGTRDADVYGPLGAAGVQTVDDEALGTRILGIRTLESQLGDIVRARGPVWRQVVKVSQVDPQTGAVTVTAQPPPPPVPVDEFAAPPAQPPATPFVPLAGLEEGTIVYAFEQTPPTGQPFGQYLGEFQVVQRDLGRGGAVIQPVLRQSWAWPRGQQIDERTARLANSRQPWILYDTMPADRHDAFERLTEEQLRAILPASTVEQYVRHGQPAGEEVDPRLKAPFNKDSGMPLTDEAVAQADPADVEWRYQRPLRDYSLMFQTIARQRIDKFAQYDALQTDIALLAAAQESAEALQAARGQEIVKLQHDLAGFTKEAEVIAGYSQAVQSRLADVSSQVQEHETALRDRAAALEAAQRQILQQLDTATAQSP